MTYQIAIPSHARPELLKNLTWAYLRETDVDLERVKVFVSNAAEARQYGMLLGAEHIVQPKKPIKNIVEKFNAIHDHYPVGTPVCVMEDDIRLITGANNKSATLAKLDAFVKEAFTHVQHGGIWGVAPHSNTFYFTGKVTRTLKLVVAHAFGFIATGDPKLRVTQLGKSDYERTCRYFIKYGATVRMDMVGVETVSYTQEGGIQAQHTTEARRANEHASCEWLVKRYPHLLKINAKKKSLFTELSFLRCTHDAEALQTIQAIVDRQLDGAR